ncbi:MAG TPA: YnbE family lipoprotein [Novosphingobium sp.]|nr:YnbE family lipoprotein [Novosphingobium sp.]
MVADSRIAACGRADLSGGKRGGIARFPALVGGAVALVAGAVALAGCVSVNAPDKPIVIELNINIKQEVIYKLSADAGKTIDSNKDIF